MADDPMAAWPRHVREGIEAGRSNGCVGSQLLSETAKIRVWHLHIPAGGWFPFHRHVLDYFWTSLSHGRTRNYFEGGRVSEATITPGLTQHKEFGPGDYMLHAVENIGDTDLDYTTVEFLGGANEPLPIPDGVRRKAAA